MGQCTPCRQAFRVIPTAGCDEWNQPAQLFPPPLEASGSEPHAQGELIHRAPGFEMLVKNSEVQLSDYRGERSGWIIRALSRQWSPCKSVWVFVRVESWICSASDGRRRIPLFVAKYDPEVEEGS